MSTQGMVRYFGRNKVPTNITDITLYADPVNSSITHNGGYQTIKTVSLTAALLRALNYTINFITIEFQSSSSASTTMRITVDGTQMITFATDTTYRTFKYSLNIDNTKNHTILIQATGTAPATHDVKELSVVGLANTVIS